MKQPISAALYMRLSRDDETYGDSVSIETQRKILTEYAQENHIPVYGEYVDDGVSGTTFERDNFKRMMEDVDAGKVNCIIVKDLSRFGREYIKTGYYLEIDFPSGGIRFIAVNDNEDTEKGLSDFAPFKSLFNEFYAKDTSRKVKAAYAAKYRAGEYITTYAPIGYKKDPDQKNHLIIDNETRWIVERMFTLAANGYGAYRICHVFFDEKIPTPAWLHYERSGDFGHIFDGEPEEKRFNWTVPEVKKILENEVYLGNTVYGKCKKISYKSKKRVDVPKEEWQIVPNTHDPIVSEDLFNRVQEQFSKRRRQTKGGTTQIFSGLLKCPDCGWTLNYCINRSHKNQDAYYRCRKYAESHRLCTPHYIRYDVLYPYVLSRLQYWTSAVHQDETAIVKSLIRSHDAENSAASNRAAMELKNAEKRLKKLDDMLAKIYEDRISGEITERNFSMLTQKYQQEQEELTEKIDTLAAQLAEDRQKTDNVEKWIETVKQYSNPTELTAELLNSLIEKIVIHEAVKRPGKIREQQIEIFYRFIGKID